MVFKEAPFEQNTFHEPSNQLQVSISSVLTCQDWAWMLLVIGPSRAPGVLSLLLKTYSKSWILQSSSPLSQLFSLSFSEFETLGQASVN